MTPQPTPEQIAAAQALAAQQVATGQPTIEQAAAQVAATPTTVPPADERVAALIARQGHIDVKLPGADGQPSGYQFRIAARSKADPTEKGNTTYTGGARWSVITPTNDSPSRSLPVEAADQIAANRDLLARITEHVNRAALIGPYKPEKATKTGAAAADAVDASTFSDLTV